MKFLNEEESISRILLKKLNESKDLKEDAWDDNFTINMIDKDKVYWKRKSDGKEIITSLDIFSKPTDPTEWKSEEELSQYALNEAEDIKNSSNETNIIKALQDIAMNYEDAGSDIEAVLTDLYKANCFNIDNLMNYIKDIQEYLTEAENIINIKKIGNPELEYTGGGIYLASIPVEIDGNKYLITLDSESEALDTNNEGEFLVCDTEDLNAVPQYGDKGLFTFDNNSPYMKLYTELKNALNSRNLTEASRLPNISKFVYDLDKDKGDAWSVNSYTEDNKGNKIIIVTKNGKSENTDKDIINAVEKKYPQLKGYETENHRGVWFYLNDINLKESIDTSEYTHKDSKFKYMLLDRLKQDCEYFLGNGNGAEKHLWAGNIDDQIKLMKDLYNSFSDNQKPEWISIEDIDNYEKQMKSYNKNSATNLNEDSYESGIFYEIEEALREGGLNPVRFNENGIMTNNIGWTVRGEDGTEQQITCDGSYLDDEEINQ